MSITRQDSKQMIDDQHKMTHGMLLALSAAGCGGIISATVAAAKGILPVTELLFFRFAIAACLLFLPARRSWALMLQRSSAAVWVSAFSGAIAAICYFTSLQMMAIGTAIILSNLSLLFIILISYFFLGDQLSVKNLCGIGLMMIAIMAQSLDEATLPDFSAILVGLLGAFSLAVCSVATRIAASRFPSTLIVFAYSAITAVVVTVLPSSSWTTPINLRIILIVAIAAVAGSGANLLVSSASRHIHAGIVSSLTKTSMIWGVLFGFLFLDQAPTIFQMISYFVMLVAVMMIQEIRLPWRVYIRKLEFKTEAFNTGCYKTWSELLKQTVVVAENMTSCEFSFHINTSKNVVAVVDAKNIFETTVSGMTELKNGILIAYYPLKQDLVIILDRGIMSHFKKSHLDKLMVTQLSVDMPNPDFGKAMQDFLPNLAHFLAVHFPRAIDEINELPDEVTLVLE